MTFSISDPTHITELGAELTTDPLGLGYTPLDGDDQQDADAINLPRGVFQRDNLIDAIAVQEAVVAADYPQAAADQWKRDLWSDILRSVGFAGLINANEGKLKDKVQLVFSGATATLANLAALQTRDGSRAEVLWGDGSLVTTEAIAKALRGG